MQQSMKVIQYANVVLLLLDIADIDRALGLSRREIILANHCIENGRCLVIVANKTDQVPADELDARMHELDLMIQRALPQARGLPIVPLSALHGDHVNRALRTAVSSFEKWSSRASTGRLNRFLQKFMMDKPPPRIGGKLVKPKYITQVH